MKTGSIITTTTGKTLPWSNSWSKPSWFCTALLIAACGPNAKPNHDHDAGEDAAWDATIDAVVDSAVDKDGPTNADSGLDAAPNPCGNGVKDEGEICDDGNNESGDGCNSTCTQQDDQDLQANAYTHGSQTQVRAAGNANLVLAVWTDDGLDADREIQLRLFGIDGAPQTTSQGNTLELVANSTTAGDQTMPDVSVAPDGNFVVVWVDASAASTQGLDIRARLFSPDGSPRTNAVTSDTNDFLVSASPAGDQTTPRVAMADNGGFMIVWTDLSGADGSGTGVFGRIFDAQGTPVTNPTTTTDSEFPIPSGATGDQTTPDVDVLPNGNWVVAWTDGSGLFDSDGTGIVATILGASGSTTLADFLVPTTTQGNQSQPAVVAEKGGLFGVLWTDASGQDDMSFSGIRARFFDGNGTAQTNPDQGDANDFLVNTVTAGRQETPCAVSAGINGQILAVWQDGSATDGSFAGIRGRLMDATGAAATNPVTETTDDFQVNSTTAEAQLAPSAGIAGPVGLIFWQDESGQGDDQSETGIRFRVLWLDW
ncbi:MAG: hypothetical protein J7M25_06000 [Deltaproteobacteria bacterium]|nr:hypothetical protein [Deltaproteobacteria bacterium]